MKLQNVIHILVGILCIGLFPNAQALSPAPDGGYPNFTTAEGTNALKNLTTGAANTAVGWFSLFSNAEGSFNTATGAGTLLFNTADENTAFGAAALLFNTTGINNTAVGAAALSNNTTAEGNTATGAFALYSNTTGTANTANGDFTLYNNISGSRNTAIGSNALSSNTAGGANTAIGNNALENNTGDFNIALGQFAGSDLTTSSHNIDIGNSGIAGESATIRIGDASQVRTFIAGISGSTIAGTGVVVDANGQLGVSPSAARFKEQIKPMDKASEALFALKPVTFRYKKEVDEAGTSQLGLVAEEVEKVNPDLVVRDKEGKPYSVRYDQVNAMLLNEFLKEHRKVENLEANAARQQKQIEALTAGLQKVSAQLEASKPAPQVVNNP
jgi:Chaperone of endosialidase